MNQDYENVKKHFRAIKYTAQKKSRVWMPVNDSLKQFDIDREAVPYSPNILETKFQEAFFFDPSDAITTVLDKTNYDTSDAKMLKMPFNNIILNIDKKFEGRLWTEKEVETRKQFFENRPKLKETAETKTTYHIKTVFIHTLAPYTHPEGDSVEADYDPTEMDGQMLVIHTMAHDKENDRPVDILELVGMEANDWDKPRSVNQFTLNLVTNFLLFANQPEVRYKTMERSQKNRERRKRKDKVPLPNDGKVEVTGELERYLKKVESMDTEIKHSHRYWVRGHWRTFHDEEHWGEDKIGEQTWIKPHTRGEGVLLEKDYEVQE